MNRFFTWRAKVQKKAGSTKTSSFFSPLYQLLPVVAPFSSPLHSEGTRGRLLPVQGELADALHHVGQDAADGTFS